MHFFQISTGLGAGNLGDEMMARAFWQHLPHAWHGEVELFPMAGQYRGSYPANHSYTSVHSGAYANAAKRGIVGLLACGTPVHEVEGLHFPMRFIAERLDAFHASATPVHAVGVGVDFLYTRRGRALFEKSFLPIRSWTVRNAACREALLDLGVPADRITIGADWAWLYQRSEDKRDWAADQWRSWDIDPSRPLLAVNIVNLVWRRKPGVKEAIAQALDAAHRELGLQIAFVSNECREGEVFDIAAANAVRSLMSSPAVVVPNKYWSIDEMLGLLAHVSVSISMRYHLGLMSCLAGAAPVMISRSQKITGLCDDLQIASLPMGACDAQALYCSVAAAMRDAAPAEAVQRLRARAAHDLAAIASGSMRRT